MSEVVLYISFLSKLPTLPDAFTTVLYSMISSPVLVLDFRVAWRTGAVDRCAVKVRANVGLLIHHVLVLPGNCSG